MTETNTQIPTTPPSGTQRVSYVSVETQDDTIRRKNLYIFNAIIWFVWILFHFTVVFFFGLKLESVFLVGLFLGLGNVVSFLSDIPIGVIQRYFSPKSLFAFAGGGLLVSAFIFLKFMFDLPSADHAGNMVESLVMFFLSDFLNIILIIVSSVLYGLIKEINDITILTYILNNSDPSEYAEILAHNNLYAGIGSLAALVLSGALLGSGGLAAVVVLIIATGVMLGYLFLYFDNPTETLDLAKMEHLKVVVQKDGLKKTQEYLTATVRRIDLGKIMQQSRVLFIRPVQTKQPFGGMKELVDATRSAMLTTFKVVWEPPRNFALLWVMVIIMFFGFWDTFVATFQIDFLKKVLEKSQEYVLVQTKLLNAYLLLGLLVIPVFVMQRSFIRLSKKIGVISVILGGIALSGFSIFSFGVFHELVLLMFFGLINSFGFAAVMPLCQATFLDHYNACHADKYNLKEIHSEASAAPLKMLLNLASVTGLVCGGFLVGILSFNGFFIFFGLVLLILFTGSMINQSKIQF